MHKIEILGSGCANCHQVEARAKQAVTEMGIEAHVEMVTDMQTILRYGVMHTPGIVVDGKVVSAGRVPAVSQIKTLLAGALREAAI